PQLVVLTKQDITEVQEQAQALRDCFTQRGFRVFTISAATGEGTRDLVEAVGLELERLRQKPESADPQQP
ncbi:MAG: GTPase ObgE, partial [Desulfuromonadaceae bacterium]